MDYRDIDYRLKQLIDRPASNHLLSHISHQASLVIPCRHTNDQLHQYKSPIPPLSTFVSLLAKRSLAKTGTLLASLVLLDRLRQRLAQFARGMPCTCQRIFLATLIVTTKILHDTSPKNKHWTKYAVYFTLPEVNLMEKQLLALMNYQLVITEKDMYYSFIQYDNTSNSILPPILHNDRHYLPKSASFNSPSSSTYNNSSSSSLSTIILQQQQQQQQKSKYKTTKKATTKNRKRLYISTCSSSSSSLSSSNSMDDLLVVTPTATASTSYNDYYYNNNNKKHLYLNNATTTTTTTTTTATAKSNPIMWLDPIISHNSNGQSYHQHYYGGNILFKN